MIRKFISGMCAVLLFLVPLISDIPLSGYAAVSALWPLDSEYNTSTTYFDPNRNIAGNTSGHNAIDIVADYYANIYAAYDGECISSCWMGDYGNLIILWHEELGIYTFYAHCASMSVYAGQTVSAGEIIGYVGSTGLSSGPHLHFGICDTLINGWPDITYYNPLTYFSYNTSDTKEPDVPTTECSCSEDYAGLYVTKNVESYLHIRSGHGSEYESVGKLYPNSTFIVTRADGNWAHIEYNGISGYCSMDYMEKAAETVSDMSVSDVKVPEGQILKGKTFNIGGVINSSRTITRVTGGIYESDGETSVFTCEKNPNSLSFDISKNFDRSMLFDRLETGFYVYKIEAEDDSGTVYDLISSSFIVSEAITNLSGDLNGDGKITVSDAVILQRVILGEIPLTDENRVFADVNGDENIDFCDMIIVRCKITE